MTESETAAAVTREPSRFPAANATADVRTLAPGASAGTPAAEAGVTAGCGSRCGCDGRCSYGYGLSWGRGGETVALPWRRLPEAAHTLASSRAVVGASSR
ncbi:hypothetical protein [Streptomyces sp. MA5143a]|uniref:hypothetical protein n=1 Tax=Streptomyces sp. MA5143a TaxID=2083010 RepID=UPI000D1A140A|nr:hypothetical protein [Streptomyces sp. MA5143a]SPF06986.1 hypothetical protein SMA5143A_7830 [Streptomyces sp. MA5143a]